MENMVPTVRGSQRILRSQGKSRRSGEVREFKSTMVQKLTKMQKKKQNCCTHTAYSSSNFFLLASLADYLYFYFFICSAALVSSVIASDWKPTLVFRMNKLVRTNDSFCSGKSGKSQGKCILQSSRNHGKSFIVPETRVFQAADNEDLVILACTVFDWSTHVTDGWTDRQTDRIVMAKTRWKQ